MNTNFRINKKYEVKNSNKPKITYVGANGRGINATLFTFNFGNKQLVITRDFLPFMNTEKDKRNASTGV